MSLVGEVSIQSAFPVAAGRNPSDSGAMPTNRVIAKLGKDSDVKPNDAEEVVARLFHQSMRLSLTKSGIFPCW